MRSIVLVLALAACDHSGTVTGDDTPDDVTDAGARDAVDITSDASPIPTDAPIETGTRVAVVVGFGAKRARSENGITWTDFAEIDHDGGDDINLLRGIGFGGGKFVAVGGASDGLIMTSTDGRAWSAPNRTPSSWLGGVAYVNNRYITAGGNGLRMWSTNATTWTVAGEHQSVHYRDVAGNGAIAVAVGHTTVTPTVGIIATTTDGVTWVERRRGGQQHNRVVFGNGVFIASGHAGKIERSTDGINWTEVALAGASGTVDLAFTGTDFIASANSKHYRSTTGTTWTAQAAVRTVHEVFAGRYLNFSWPAQIQATQNLTTWSSVFNPAGTGLTRMAVGVVP